MTTIATTQPLTPGTRVDVCRYGETLTAIVLPSVDGTLRLSVPDLGVVLRLPRGGAR